jgi:hypothetical protein
MRTRPEYCTPVAVAPGFHHGHAPMLCKLGNGFFNFLIACHLLALPVKACVPASVPVQVVQGNTPAIARGLDTVGKLAKDSGKLRGGFVEGLA